MCKPGHQHPNQTTPEEVAEEESDDPYVLYSCGKGSNESAAAIMWGWKQSLRRNWLSSAINPTLKTTANKSIDGPEFVVGRERWMTRSINDVFSYQKAS